MGAQQAYEWAVRFPAMVERLAAIAGTARTAAYNALVLRFAEEAILDAPTAEEGLRRHAHVWAATGLSTELFREEAWRDAGFTSVDDLVRRLFEDDVAPMDPDNLLGMCRKWRTFDVSRHTGGDLPAALARIGARTFVMPFSNDSLFPVADCAREQAAHRRQRAPRDRQPVGSLGLGDDALRPRGSRPASPRAARHTGTALAFIV